MHQQFGVNIRALVNFVNVVAVAVDLFRKPRWTTSLFFQRLLYQFAYMYIFGSLFHKKSVCRLFTYSTPTADQSIAGKQAKNDSRLKT